MEVADASEAVLVSNFSSGYDRVDAVRAKYGSEPWFKYIHGNVTFAVLEMRTMSCVKKGRNSSQTSSRTMTRCRCSAS